MHSILDSKAVQFCSTSIFTFKLDLIHQFRAVVLPRITALYGNVVK